MNDIVHHPREPIEDYGVAEVIIGSREWKPRSKEEWKVRIMGNEKLKLYDSKKSVVHDILKI